MFFLNGYDTFNESKMLQIEVVKFQASKSMKEKYLVFAEIKENDNNYVAYFI
jgi:hypothetical protein